MLQTRNEPSLTSPDSRIAALESLIARAKGAGADAAEAVFAESRALSVGVRKGELETVERDETNDLGLRVFVGRKQAVVSVSEFSTPTPSTGLVERAVAMARLAPDDPYASLADPDRLYRAARDEASLEICDDSTLSAEALQQRALDIEATGLALDTRLQPDAASTGYVQNHWHMVTSDGFQGEHRTSLFYQSGRFIAAGPDGAMERDGDGRSVRYREDLPGLAETGETGARRALAALGARKLDTQKVAVMFDNRTGKSLLGQLLGAISGTMIARGSRFLKDRLGTQLFSPDVQVIDDPLRRRGLGSCLFDDEGITVSRRSIIENGILTTWLLNTAAGKQLGMASTGHASRGLASPPGVSTHNAVIAAGSRFAAGPDARASAKAWSSVRCSARRSIPIPATGRPERRASGSKTARFSIRSTRSPSPAISSTCSRG